MSDRPNDIVVAYMDDKDGKRHRFAWKFREQQNLAIHKANQECSRLECDEGMTFIEGHVGYIINAGAAGFSYEKTGTFDFMPCWFPRIQEDGRMVPGPMDNPRYQ
jgi:hypothetical protein